MGCETLHPLCLVFLRCFLPLMVSIGSSLPDGVGEDSTEHAGKPHPMAAAAQCRRAGLETWASVYSAFRLGREFVIKIRLHG